MQRISSVSGISGDVVLVSVLLLDIVSISSDLQSISLMRVQSESFLKMNPIQSTISGYRNMLISTDGHRAIESELR